MEPKEQKVCSLCKLRWTHRRAGPRVRRGSTTVVMRKGTFHEIKTHQHGWHDFKFQVLRDCNDGINVRMRGKLLGDKSTISPSTRSYTRHFGLTQHFGRALIDAAFCISRVYRGMAHITQLQPGHYQGLSTQVGPLECASSQMHVLARSRGRGRQLPEALPDEGVVNAASWGGLGGPSACRLI